MRAYGPDSKSRYGHRCRKWKPALTHTTSARRPSCASICATRAIRRAGSSMLTSARYLRALRWKRERERPREWVREQAVATETRRFQRRERERERDWRGGESART